MANKSSISNYDQTLYIDGRAVSGVTSINGGYDINQEPIHILGKGFAFGVKQGPLVGSFDISKYYIGKEVLLNYTGDNPIKGSINYGDKTFGFEAGYLTEYSLSCGIGQIPSATASFQVYGDIGAGINAEGNTPHPQISIPNQGSIEIDLDGYLSNRITDFSFNMRMNRTPIYTIGSPFPILVNQVFPIIQECNFTMEVFDYEVHRLKEFLKSPIEQNISLTINNPIDNSHLDTFTLNKAKLLNESISSSSDNSLSVNLTYSAYINNK